MSNANNGKANNANNANNNLAPLRLYHVFWTGGIHCRAIAAGDSFTARRLAALETNSEITNLFAVRDDLMSDKERARIYRLA